MKPTVSKAFLILMVLSIIIIRPLKAQKLSFDVDLLTKKKSPVDSSIANAAYSKDYSPFVRIFLPQKADSRKPAVVICPGGGYSMVAIGHEGYSWARYFNDRGIAVLVLKYRLPAGNWKTTFSDAEEALKMVNDSSKMWGINMDKIGIMGFSAGGHLASTIATHTKPPVVPKFQILFYPVITMDPAGTHMGSHDNLLGRNATKEQEDLLSNEKQVSDLTPPAFIVLAGDDKVVPPANGINYFLALNRHNVKASLHVYPTGNHGWGYRMGYKFQNEILNELSLWLKDIE